MARHIVILAGGSGTRLWPRSREKSPKHLLTLQGSQSLLQSTVERVARLTENVYVVTERSQVKSIREQLPHLRDEQFIVEPARRGTASALGLAALAIAEHDPQAIMLSVHADHYLGHDEDAYLKTLDAEARWAESKRSLVTVGLRPPYASTAFGYIQVGLERVRHARRAGRQDEADRVYQTLPTEAIDYAVLERTKNLLVVGATFEWHDLGSWADLHDILQQDEAGNFVEGDSVLIDSKNCMIHSPHKLVAAVGLEDMVVIETDDAILICPKARSQDVKLIVDRLKQMGKTEYL